MIERRYVFVVGLHRSGTTPLARSLAGHPEVSAFEKTGAPMDEGQHLTSVLPTGVVLGGPGRFGFHPEARRTEAPADAIERDRKQLLRDWEPYWDLSKPCLLEKSPPNLLRTRYLQSLLPRSSFVVILRHPLVVALATQKWSKTSIGSLVEHWLRCHSALVEDLKHLRDPIVLTYEELVASPASVLRCLARRLDLADQFDSSVFARDSNAGYLASWRDKKRTPWGAWRARQLEARYEQSLHDFGYTFASGAPLDEAPVGLARLRLAAEETPSPAIRQPVRDPLTVGAPRAGPTCEELPRQRPSTPLVSIASDAGGDVTAIVKTFERPRCLERLVRSLRKRYPSLPVLVADDSRPPCSAAGRARVAGLVDEYIPLPFDSGVSVGRNTLLARVRTRYFLLLDDDFVVSERTDIARLRWLLEAHEMDIVAGLVRDRMAWQARARRAIKLTLRGRPFAAVKDWRRTELGDARKAAGRLSRSGSTLICRSLPYTAPITSCDFVPNFFLGRVERVRDGIGGWDDAFKTCEHADFMLRAWIASLRVGVTHDVSVDHLPRTSPFYASHRRTRRNVYHQRFLRKHDLEAFVRCTASEPCVLVRGEGPHASTTTPA